MILNWNKSPEEQGDKILRGPHRKKKKKNIPEMKDGEERETEVKGRHY